MGCRETFNASQRYDRLSRTAEASYERHVGAGAATEWPQGAGEVWRWEQGPDGNRVGKWKWKRKRKRKDSTTVGRGVCFGTGQKERLIGKERTSDWGGAFIGMEEWRVRFNGDKEPGNSEKYLSMDDRRVRDRCCDDGRL